MRGEFDRSMIAVVALLAALCLAPRAQAASGPEIDASARATLEDFFREIWSGRELANKAAAILVFPRSSRPASGSAANTAKACCRSRQDGRLLQHISASIGFQLGAQARSVIIMFMTPNRARRFQRTDGWKVGVDGSVAIVTVGAGGAIDTNTCTVRHRLHLRSEGADV